MTYLLFIALTAAGMFGAIALPDLVNFVVQRISK